MSKQIKLEKACRKWNKENPPGTEVIYYLRRKPFRDGTSTRTKSFAWVIGGHSLVVLLNGFSGCTSIDHIKRAT